MFIGKIAIVIVTSSCVQATFYRIFFLKIQFVLIVRCWKSMNRNEFATYEFVN